MPNFGQNPLLGQRFPTEDLQFAARGSARHAVRTA
jgi:hypothetical protein